jgi:hypothetical protein
MAHSPFPLGLRNADRRALSEIFGEQLPTTVADLLTLEYGHRHGRLWPGAPTAAGAHNQRRRLRKRLRRYELDFQGAHELAATLEACTADHRCASGGCPKDLRAAQRVIVSILGHHCKTVDTKQLVALSIIFPAWRAPINELKSLCIANVRSKLIETLERSANFNWLALGMDVSLNDDKQKGLGIGWQLQWYGIASVEDHQSFAKAIRNFVFSSETVKRPVRVVACDGSPTALSYILKTNFVRRVAYWGYGVTRSGQLRRCWRTRKVSLRAPEEVELRIWLDRIGIENRLLFMSQPMSIRT